MLNFVKRIRVGRNSGFTLIELLVVIAIIGILASIVLASLNTARVKSRNARRIADLKQIQLALELYFDGNSSVYPAALSSLAPTYIPVVPTDPLASAAYSYAYYPATNSTYYHLGASMELEGGVVPSALSSDRDCNSTTGAGCSSNNAYTGGFNGNNDLATATGCSGLLTGRPCYDVSN